MTRNPLLNALAAAGYIGLVVAIMFLSGPDSNRGLAFIVPLAFISLFTLSVAVMGYIFFFKPFKLYFNGQEEEAVKLFIKTVLFFGIITAVIVTALFFRPHL